MPTKRSSTARVTAYTEPRTPGDSGGILTPIVQNVNPSDAGYSSSTSIQKTSSIDQVCLIIDLEGFRVPTQWVERCLREDGRQIDMYLWGPISTFVVRELGWCPILHPSDLAPMSFDPSDRVWDEQEECTGNVKWAA